MYTPRISGKWRMAMVSLSMWCLLLIATPRCEAQNLVPNHSFEEYDTCRVFNDVYYPDNGPLGWFSAAGTPDHFMSCLPYGSFNGAPLNAWSFQYPQDGECYAAVTTYREFPELREYFMVQLIEPLTVGQQYYASFYVSAGWGGYATASLYLATSGVGMVFTTMPRQWELGDPYPAPLNYAHIHSEAIITDTVGWTLVSGSFVADSTYQYVMLGNPFDNASTDTLHFATHPWVAQGYVLIDNVCVSADPSGCPMVTEIGEHEKEALILYPNPAQQWVILDRIEIGSHFSVRDMLGRSVWQGRASGSRMRIDVGHWARGSYVLSLEGEGVYKTIKFVLVE
jgi:hypothetical protein